MNNETLFVQVMGTIYELLVNFGYKIAGCILAYLIGSKIISYADKKLKNSKLLNKTDDNIKAITLTTVKVALWSVLIITMTSILGIETSSIIALLTSLGVTVGLALQGTMSNVAGGIMIYVLKPFKAGDFVEAGGATGTVTKISLFHTHINTADAKVILIPNSNVTSGKITNYSTSGNRRVDIDFSVGYDSDIEKVKNTILKTALAHDKVLKNPLPFARMTKQDASALVFTLRAWVNNVDYWDVYFDMLEQMKKAFDEAGITIPYNQLDVHLSSDK